MITDNPHRADFLLCVTDRLQHDMEYLHHIIDRLKDATPSFTTDHIIREFQRCQSEDTLFGFMTEIIAKLTSASQISTAHNYKCALKSFTNFRQGIDIPLSALDSIIFEDYQSFLKERGLTWNSISFYLRIMRAVYNRAVRRKLTIDRHPFDNVFTGMEKTRKRAISQREIKSIRNLNLSQYPALDYARDIFIFLFCCRGMSFIDAAFLKKSNIINGVIVYRRHKTGRQLQIKIVEPIQTLLDKYSNPDSPFLLPIINNIGNNELRQYRSALRMVNKHLKIIEKMAAISTHLTTYVSRHSWATIAKTKNVPLSVISDALGHESLMTTQIYLDSIGASEIDQANDLVIKDL